MNFDPILKNLGKYFSNNQDSAEYEISNLEHLFKGELREAPEENRNEIAFEKLKKHRTLANDKTFDFEDILTLKDALEGKRKLDEKEFEYADLNHDGVVDYKDLNLMIDVVVKSRKAEDRVFELQGVYEELLMKHEQGLTNSDLDKVRMNTVKAEFEQAIGDFILRSHKTN